MVIVLKLTTFGWCRRVHLDSFQLPPWMSTCGALFVGEQNNIHNVRTKKMNGIFDSMARGYQTRLLVRRRTGNREIKRGEPMKRFEKRSTIRLIFPMNGGGNIGKD